MIVLNNRSKQLPDWIMYLLNYFQNISEALKKINKFILFLNVNFTDTLIIWNFNQKKIYFTHSFSVYEILVLTIVGSTFYPSDNLIIWKYSTENSKMAPIFIFRIFSQFPQKLFEIFLIFSENFRNFLLICLNSPNACNWRHRIGARY